MTDYSAADPSQPRGGRIRRWIGRVLGLVNDTPHGRADTMIPEPSKTDRSSRIETVTFYTPAKGDAYEFMITVEICICATGHQSRHDLDQVLTSRLSDLVAELKSAARPEARKHPIFRPGAAEPRIAAEIETAVRQALIGVPDEQGASLQAKTRVRVDMPEAVRELQRQMVNEQVQIEARYEHSEQAALRLGELREVWSKFIKDGLPEWDTPYAVHMAQQPSQASATLYTLRKDRRDEAEKLVDVVVQVTKGNERMDLLEFALATDSALRKTHELLGIAPPPAGGDSVFDDAQKQEK